MGIPRVRKVHSATVQVAVPPQGRGLRRRPVPDEEPREVEKVLSGQPWRRMIWRQGTKGALAARFAAFRVRLHCQRSFPPTLEIKVPQ